jgi:c-di-GMP-binding flagellar brake protein YcgR
MGIKGDCKAWVRGYSAYKSMDGIAELTMGTVQQDFTQEINSFKAINEILQVKILDDQHSTSYHSRINDISDGRLTIAWPTSRGMRLLVRRDQMLEFSFLRDGTPYAFSGLVDETILEPLPQITVIISSAVMRVQRRQNFRIKSLMPVEITGEFKSDPGDETPVMQSIRTTTYDLSASGISVLYAKRIPEGTLLEVKLSLPDNGPVIRIPCRVIYSESLAENVTQHRTGILFLELSEGERARMVRYVYRTQLKGLRT